MLDPYVRPYIDPPLNILGKKIFSYNISANNLTLLGFLMGICAMVLIALKFYTFGAIFIVLNRILDGLDGAVARYQGLTDFGGFLDIVCDFIIYAGVVFAFGFADPKNLFASAFLIFSFIGPISSFLAYAIVAAKRNIQTTIRGKKSFYYLGGICEGTETAATLILMCLLPNYVTIICLIYGILCWLTTLGRILNAWQDFGKYSVNVKHDFSDSESSYIQPEEETKHQVL